VPAGAIHRLENPSTEEILEVIEVDVGSAGREGHIKVDREVFGTAEDQQCG
jgi:mannose-6-phosphate isomerase-like protein (cupin superfamily)